MPPQTKNLFFHSKTMSPILPPENKMLHCGISGFT